jgi:hypothetical protein
MAKRSKRLLRAWQKLKRWEPLLDRSIHARDVPRPYETVEGLSEEIQHEFEAKHYREVVMQHRQEGPDPFAELAASLAEAGYDVRDAENPDFFTGITVCAGERVIGYCNNTPRPNRWIRRAFLNVLNAMMSAEYMPYVAEAAYGEGDDDGDDPWPTVALVYLIPEFYTDEKVLEHARTAERCAFEAFEGVEAIYRQAASAARREPELAVDDDHDRTRLLESEPDDEE